MLTTSCTLSSLVWTDAIDVWFGLMLLMFGLD